jgi:pyruvate dehydrogenase E1 component
MEKFRQEVGGEGLSSYPHPRLMPDFWEFPTVSMGLGAMTAIHQARFNRYLEDRGLISTSTSRVWYTMGDGESDEPESLSQLSLAGREGLDNIVMTMNCNLQRLDGPVRGNSKIVQELEGRYRGAGWNVIKVLWGSSWDDLFERDTAGHLANRLNGLVDGDEQRLMTADGATIRKELFNTEALAALVAHLSDDDLVALCADVGGHDFVKLHAAYAQATAHKGQPTVVLIRTIKGYGLGPSFAGRNTTHQKKKADMDTMQFMRDDLGLAFSDKDLESYPYVLPEDVPDLVAYAKARREALGGFLPKRTVPAETIEFPEPAAYAEFDEGTK